jgi:prophage antirepressor-like protein
MTTAAVLKFENRRLHALKRVGSSLIWFVLADVCEILEIEKPRNVAARLDDDQKGARTMGTLGGQQRMLIVSEDAVYEIACTSRKPVANRFKRWLYREVLPEIRQTGGYQGSALPLDALIGELQPAFDLSPPEARRPANEDDDADDTNARSLWTGNPKPREAELPVFKRNAWIEQEDDAICMVTQRDYPDGAAMMMRFVSDAAPTSTRLVVLEPNGKRLLICVDHIVPLAVVLRCYAQLGRGPMAETTLSTLRHYLAR